MAPVCAADNAGLTLPAGFCASIFADSLGGARHMAIASNGDVLIIRQNRQRGDTTGGGIMVFRPQATGRAKFVGSFGPVGGTGIAIEGRALYVDAKTAILRFPYSAGAAAPSGAPDTVVKGLPTGGHAARARAPYLHRSQ